MNSDAISKFVKMFKDEINANQWAQIYFTLPDKFSMFEVSDITKFLHLCEIFPEDYLTEIPRGFFFSNNDLTNYTIHKNITTIDPYAFNSAKNLKTVKISSDLELIDVAAFQNCESLTSIVIPDTCNTIKNSAFMNCKKLQKVKLPKSLTMIDQTVFCNCTSLVQVTIPDAVGIISTSAFDGCSGLKKVILPKNLTVIESNAFFNCKNLEVLVYPYTASQFATYVECQKGWNGYCPKLSKIICSDKQWSFENENNA